MPWPWEDNTPDFRTGLFQFSYRIMAASLLGGAAVGAVFGELLSAVLKMKDKTIMFKQTLTDLQSTLEAIAPVIKEIEQQNNELGRPKQELERFIREMEEGTKLVCKCSQIHWLNYPARVRYQDQLVALFTSLVRFITLEMQAQSARDQKETLLKVRRIHSAVKKMSLASTEDATDLAPAPVPVPVPVPVDLTEIENTNGANFVEEHITSLTQESSQSEAEAENNQTVEHFMSEQSSDQYPSIDEERFLGICLPKIKPILPIIGGFNHRVRKDPQKIIGFDGRHLKLNHGYLLRGSAEVNGMGSYGATYKAILENGTALAVKWLNDVMLGKEEFEQQLKIVHRISQHPNVISLLACYYSSDAKLMIYDHINASSLSSFLQETTGKRLTLQDWDSRVNIFLGVARGIAHIHSAEGRKFIHGNINSCSVLVMKDFEGYISDFGLTSLVRHAANPPGDECYIAPEVIETGELTEKSDVYSFGVLLIEMLTNERPNKLKQPTKYVDSRHKVRRWADEMFDPELGEAITRVDEIEELAMKCAAREPHKRPSMEEVVEKIEEVKALNFYSPI